MYKLALLKTLFLLSILLTVSCGTLVPSPSSDDEFEAAVKQAHNTLDTLRQAILAPDPSRRFIGLKVRFAGEDGVFEDHWTEPVDYYNNVYTIRLLDGLTFDIGLHPDQFIDVSEKDVLDWMIVESNGKLVGGYTIRLTYKHLTSEQKKEFLRTTGYVIE